MGCSSETDWVNIILAVIVKELYKSYYILLPYVLYCICFLRTSACVCRTSENCKSLVLQDKCNIEIFLYQIKWKKHTGAKKFA